ncbi:MAG: hypothetical protein AAFV95_15855 [Bacteroidota bacterium]
MKIQVLDKELKRVFQEVQAKRKTETYLKNIDRMLLDNEAELADIERSIEEEMEDVDRLSRLNLYSLFQKLLGKKEEALELEKQELLYFVLKRKGILSSMAGLRQQKERLLANYSSKFQSEHRLDELLAQKIKQLKLEGHPLSKDILFYETRMANNQAKRKEIQEAIRRGEKVIEYFGQTIMDLERIESWGRTRYKYTYEVRNQSVRKIKNDIYKTHRQLVRFEKELYDLSDHYEMNYLRQVQEMQLFLDQLIDNLITDWVVKSRITNSIGLILLYKDKITRILSILRYEIEKTEEYISTDKKELTQILEQHFS